MNQPQFDPSVYDAAQMQAAQETAWGAMIVFGLIAGYFTILMLCSVMGIFIKAGKPWWAAIVPIYNIIVLLEILGRPIWWIVLMFIPVVNFIISIVLANDLSKAFGKDIGYTLGLIFVGFVFYPMLAFGSAQYRGPQAA